MLFFYWKQTPTWLLWWPIHLGSCETNCVPASLQSFSREPVGSYIKQIGPSSARRSVPSATSNESCNACCLLTGVKQSDQASRPVWKVALRRAKGDFLFKAVVKSFQKTIYRYDDINGRIQSLETSEVYPNPGGWLPPEPPTKIEWWRSVCTSICVSRVPFNVYEGVWSGEMNDSIEWIWSIIMNQPQGTHRLEPVFWFIAFPRVHLITHWVMVPLLFLEKNTVVILYFFIVKS